VELFGLFKIIHVMDVKGMYVMKNIVIHVMNFMILNEDAILSLWNQNNLSHI